MAKTTMANVDKNAVDGLLWQIRTYASEKARKLRAYLGRHSRDFTAEQFAAEALKEASPEQVADELLNDHPGETAVDVAVRSSGLEGDQAVELRRRLELARQQACDRILAAELPKRTKAFMLSIHLTSGKRRMPYSQAELYAQLSQLSRVDLDVVGPFLEKVIAVGLIDRGGYTYPTAPATLRFLSEGHRKALKRWLDHSGEVEQFFKANPELGGPDEYDLSEFGIKAMRLAA